MVLRSRPGCAKSRRGPSGWGGPCRSPSFQSGTSRPARRTRPGRWGLVAAGSRGEDLTMIKGVMFDFSGTLFRVEPTAGWLSAVAAGAGTAATAAELAVWAERLEEAGGTARRGLSRAASGGAHGAVGGPRPERRGPPRRVHRADPRIRAALAGARGAAVRASLHTRRLAAVPRHREHAARTAGAGVPVAVVSNIGWDLRPVFRHHGLDGLVDAYVLSYEEGVQKPDAPIFATACEALGLPPEAVLMVGDSREADGGAAALGCRVHFVEHLPVGERPDGLAEVLRLL
ncbi:HAD family hydrolase [Streptomyces sp. NPDC052494]|uniref:HAD family hydrolase n=1 Tax=Streptomyces sp. NPDC052494 TaxID=3365692 RepID=UPI0037D7C034